MLVTCWERDGAVDSETFRARLLDLLEHLVQLMQGDAPPHVLMGGETALLDEIGLLRPDLRALLVVYNAAGQVSLGPWCMIPLVALASGEALVRNLHAAQNAAEHDSLNLTTTAFMPDLAGLPAQLPQILQGFDVTAIVVGRGAPLPRQPVRWHGPDGSSLLALNMEPGSTLYRVGERPLRLQTLKPDTVSNQPGVSLEIFAAALDPVATRLNGELLYRNGAVDLQAGLWTTRLDLKQTNARLQSDLIAGVEPWLALALTHGKVISAANLHALWQHTWRLLLHNQSYAVSQGHEAAAAETQLRSQQIDALNHYIGQHARQALHDAAPPRAREAYIKVWNPHHWTTQSPVVAALHLPDDRYPARLLDAAGNETTFAWVNNSLHFIAEVPPVGYTTYTLELGTEAVETAVVAAGTEISTALGDEKLLVADDQLIWQHVTPAVVKDGEVTQPAQETVRAAGLLRFMDGGDAGDAQTYRQPEPDVLVEATMLTNLSVESTRLYQRLIFQHRLRVAPALNAERGRTRGVKGLDMVSSATLYHQLPGIYFQTRFENTVRDHRLRAHIRTGLRSAHVLAESAFDLATRPVQAGQGYPLHTLCAVDDGDEALALLARGLPEYEALPESNQVTLALTLLRAFGQGSTQNLQPLVAEFALLPLASGDPSALLRASRLYRAPLRAEQVKSPPKRLTHSYLILDDSPLILTALKPPESGTGWIVRLLNPTGTVVTTTLQTPERLRAAQVVSLAEKPQQTLAIDGGHAVQFTLKPKQVLTLRLEFTVPPPV